MNFRLLYTGQVPTKRRRLEAEQRIRQHFHKQLRKLWQLPPLSDHPGYQNPANDGGRGYSLAVDLHGYQFMPLVNRKLKLFAEVEVLLMIQGPRAGATYHGGDIDNRLKTLIDAMSIPRQRSKLRDTTQTDKSVILIPDKSETPFYCVLEDDSLLTGLTVKTDWLLTEEESCDVVHAVLEITLKGPHGAVLHSMDLLI